MIRSTQPADTPILVELADRTGVFKPIEIQALREVLDDYHATNHAQNHHAVTLEESGTVLGFAYFAQAAMTDRTWSVWWIVVARTEQARGLGTTLMRYIEDEVRRHSGRVLFIETSSTPHYEPTRRFYLKLGYEITAALRDYYADGDDMVVFRKRMA
jgi:ribosomal protein S18 acetylase RimI-like enzyme